MRNFFSMCSADVAIKVWMREWAASLRASAAREMSRSLARDRPQMVASLMARAMACTASKSPIELAGNPASITSTLRRSSWRAIRSFSSRVMDAPGDCSPSRKVVSKMISLSVMGSCSRGNSYQAVAGAVSGVFWRPIAWFLARCKPLRMAFNEADTMLASIPTPNTVCCSSMRSSR